MCIAWLQNWQSSLSRLLNKGRQLSSPQPQGRSGKGCCRLAGWKIWYIKAVAGEEDGLRGKFLQCRAGWWPACKLPYCTRCLVLLAQATALWASRNAECKVWKFQYQCGSDLCCKWHCNDAIVGFHTCDFCIELHTTVVQPAAFYKLVYYGHASVFRPRALFPVHGSPRNNQKCV